MEIILGLVTGLLIGLTGTGGGVLLTPLLLLLTSFPTTVIIGTSLLVGAVTKAAGAIEHRRLGHVHGRLALLLIAGSVPGALSGVLLIQKIQSVFLASQLDSFLRWVLALTLLGVAVFLPFVSRKRNRGRPKGPWVGRVFRVELHPPGAVRLPWEPEWGSWWL